jgi:predicted ATPase
MLTEITLRHFKSHRETKLTLDESRLHAVVGQNSSGKTSILQALHYLSQLVHRPFSAIFQYERAPEYLVSSGEKQVEVIVDGYWGYNARQYWAASFSWEYQEENDWHPSCTWKLNETTKESGGWSSYLADAPYPLPQALGRAIYLKLVASNLAQAAYSDEVVPRVGYDGSGLAPTLDYLRSENPETFHKIQELLQHVVPGVRQMEVRRAKVEVLRQRTIEVDGKALPYEERREMTGQEVVFNMNSGERLPAHAISEGTILTLGLLTVLLNPHKPTLVLLDDIEQGLHPYAQRELIRVIKQILQENPNLQILFSTHSPYIIDELMPSQVHVLNSTTQGFTLANRLDQNPNAAWATQTLTTGEFWDAEGEAWVTGEAVSA